MGGHDIEGDLRQMRELISSYPFHRALVSVLTDLLQEGSGLPNYQCCPEPPSTLHLQLERRVLPLRLRRNRTAVLVPSRPKYLTSLA